MKYLTMLICFQALTLPLFAQSYEYADVNNQLHWAGEIGIEVFESDPYSSWYKESNSAYKLAPIHKKIKKRLKQLNVRIYLGTWCGDTKNYFPKFMKLMKHYGVGSDQIELIVLSSVPEPYKQSPGKSEIIDRIHRVPTFIFYEAKQEVGRIVEYPVTDLETDVAQLCLDYPVRPNYFGVHLLLQYLDENIPNDDKGCLNLARKINRYITKSSELNTLGYVLMARKELDKSLAVFKINTLIYPYVPNVYDSYGEALLEDGQTDKAIKAYQRVLELDRNNENAIKMLNKIAGK